MKKILLILLVFGTTTLSYADDLFDVLASSGGFSIIGNVGLNRLDSDIKPDYNLSGILTSPNLDVSMEYNIHPLLSVGMTFGVMMFNQEDNNEKFQSGNIFTFNYIAIDLLNLVTAVRIPRWNVWARAGMGFGGLLRPNYTIAPGHEYTLNNADVRTPDAYFVFPVGLGVEYHINNVISLSLGGRYFFTNTDYLETVARYNQYDLWQSVGFSVRYKFAFPDRMWSRY